VFDTFASTQGWNMGYYVPADWQARLSNIYIGPKTPAIIWQSLNN
jgi:hypothetical protein